MKPTSSSLLFERLRALGLDIPADAVLRKTYVTRASRRGGAWSWYITDGQGKDLNIGSQHTVGELMQSVLLIKRDSNGNTNIQINFGLRPLGRLDPSKSMIGQ